MGRASTANRKTLSGASLQRHLDQYFSSGIVHRASAPEIRAIKHRPNGQLTLHQTTLKWNREAMEKAAREFEVPEGLRILLLLPEIFHYKILVKHERYRCGPTVGIKTPCPWTGCFNTNSWTTPVAFMLDKNLVMEDLR